jgi:hypothetical protein
LDQKQSLIQRIEQELEEQKDISNSLSEEVGEWKMKYEEIRGEICTEIAELNTKYEEAKSSHKVAKIAIIYLSFKNNI